MKGASKPPGGVLRQQMTEETKPKEKRKRGRPPKLTPEYVDAICKGVRLGLTFKDACEFAGISQALFYLWKQRAEGETSGKYFNFMEKLKKALVQGKALHLKRIHEASQGGQTVTETRVTKDKAGNVIETVTVTKTALPVWQASAWILERRHADEWGRHIQPAVNNDEEDPMDKWIDDLNKAAQESAGDE